MNKKAAMDLETPPATNLRQKAERRLGGKVVTRVDGMAAVDVRALLHELQVHQIELEMQNEELLRTQTAMREISDKYHDLFDFAPIGYFFLDSHIRILEANLAGAAILGLDRNAVIQKRFAQFVTTECRPAFAEFCSRVLTTETIQTCEIRLPKDGQHVDVLLEGIVAKGGHEKLCRVAIIDITARKQAEEKLAESDRRKDQLVATSTSR